MDKPLIESVAAVMAPAGFATAGVGAFVTGRRGGFSEAPYGALDGSPGLNLGLNCGDDPQKVLANRERVERAVGRPIRWLNQTHGIRVAGDADQVCPEQPPQQGAARGQDTVVVEGTGPSFDAVVSTRTDVALAIQIADCLPVLLRSQDGAVIAGAHAGWRGLAAGILEATVAAMREAQAAKAGPGTAGAGAGAGTGGGLLAWMGPCIGPARFEVGELVRAAFVGRDAAAKAGFTPSGRIGHCFADLRSLARLRLEALGVGIVESGPSCTFDEAGLFWSHRRKRDCGRMAAVIWRD